eukprot:3396966-Pleurochrysis_carterae.AAC.1
MKSHICGRPDIDCDSLIDRKQARGSLHPHASIVAHARRHTLMLASWVRTPSLPTSLWKGCARSVGSSASQTPS